MEIPLKAVTWYRSMKQSNVVVLVIVSEFKFAVLASMGAKPENGNRGLNGLCKASVVMHPTRVLVFTSNTVAMMPRRRSDPCVKQGRHQ